MRVTFYPTTTGLKAAASLLASPAFPTAARLLAACVALRFQVNVTPLHDRFSQRAGKIPVPCSVPKGTQERDHRGSPLCQVCPRRFHRHRSAVTRKAAIKCLVFIIHETKARTC